MWLRIGIVEGHTLREIVKRFKVSPALLCRELKKEMGVGPLICLALRHDRCMTSQETLAFQRSFASKHSEFVQTARGVIKQTANEVFADTTGPGL